MNRIPRVNNTRAPLNKERRAVAFKRHIKKGIKPRFAPLEIDIPVTRGENVVIITVRGENSREVKEAASSLLADYIVTPFKVTPENISVTDQQLTKVTDQSDRDQRWNKREEDFRKNMITRLDCIKSTEVGKILYPNAKESRNAVANRRKNGELIGLKAGRDYEFPRFQFDTEGNCIKDVVAYANKIMGAEKDPWGVAEWWITRSAVLGDQEPIDALVTGTLDRGAIDRIWKYEME